MNNLSFKYPLLSFFTVIVMGGCGGTDSASTGNPQTTCTDPAQCNNGGNGTSGGGFGNFTFGGNNGVGGANTKPPGPNCGDSIVNPDEECDKGNLNGKTCATASLGAKPSGVLVCAANCTFDLAGCTTSGGPGGTGGTSGGTGGRPGTGGRFGGTGGGP